MRGRIVKAISGFYYVYASGKIYACRAKGIFRQEGTKPLVGDEAEIAVLDEEACEGNVEKIYPRKNELIRPQVANIDMTLIVFAVRQPDPSLLLLDKMLCMMEYQKVPVTVCFNKCDLADESECGRLFEIYHETYPILFVSAKTGENIEKLRDALGGRTVSVAGPSGVGKSSLINCLQTEIQMETGEVSRKIGRGKNTTRHAQIIPIDNGTFIVDTPGFAAFDLPELTREDLWKCFPEFLPYEGSCRFAGCSHISEPDCGVRAALEAGKISTERYENYKILYEKLGDIRRH